MNPPKLERIAQEIVLKIKGTMQNYFPKPQENNNMEWKKGLLKTHQRYLKRKEQVKSQNSYSQTSEPGSEQIF